MRERMKAKNIMVSILVVCLILSLGACGSFKISEGESMAETASDFEEGMEDSTPEMEEASEEIPLETVKNEDAVESLPTESAKDE